MREAKSPRESLLLFIGGSVELYAAHPVHMAALAAIAVEIVALFLLSRILKRRTTI